MKPEIVLEIQINPRVKYVFATNEDAVYKHDCWMVGRSGKPSCSRAITYTESLLLREVLKVKIP